LTGHLHSNLSGSKGTTRSRPARVRDGHATHAGDGPSSVGTRRKSSAAQVHAPLAVQLQSMPPSPQGTPLQVAPKPED